MIEWFTVRDVNALGIGAFGPTCVDPPTSATASILQTPARVARLWSSRRVRRRPRDSGDLRHGRERCLPRRSSLRLLQGLEDAVYVTIGTGAGARRHVRRQAPSRHAAPRGRPHAVGGPVPPRKGRAASARATRAVSRASPPAPPSPRAGKARGRARGQRWCGRSRGLSGADVREPRVLMYSPRRIVLGGGVMQASRN